MQFCCDKKMNKNEGGVYMIVNNITNGVYEAHIICMKDLATMKEEQDSYILTILYIRLLENTEAKILHLPFYQ